MFKSTKDTNEIKSKINVTTKLIVKIAAYLIGQIKRQLATRIKSILIT